MDKRNNETKISKKLYNRLNTNLEERNKYSNIKNDISLLTRHLPTENDMIIFEEKLKKHKKLSIILNILILIYGTLFFKNLITFFLELDYTVLFYTIISFLCSIVLICISKKIILSKLEIDFCDYGKITDKYYDVIYEKYYAIVSVNQNLFKFQIKRKKYDSLEINDDVIIFAIKNSKCLYINKK